MKKVLVIDDEKDILELIAIILSEEGIEVYKASGGVPGLAMAREVKPDLILLDIMMPEVDGWEVLKMLKIDDDTKAIPVAMLTCKTETRDKVFGIQEGAMDYITKPFAPEDLLARVNTILSQGNGGR